MADPFLPADEAMQDPSADLLERYCAGSEQAAERIFHRYVERLCRLARSKLSPALAPRIDPEDVVLSAYRSFFVGARKGRFYLRHNGDLWRLLVTITLRKLYRQSAHHGAGMRSIRRERSDDAWKDFVAQAISREPSPADAAATVDELESIMSQLTALQRQILELRMQGFLIDEIAAETNRSERTIRRALISLQERLAERLGLGDDGPPD